MEMKENYTRRCDAGIAPLRHGDFIHSDTLRVVRSPDNAVFFRVAVVHQVSVLKFPSH
jgi:hypothetical protein